MLQIVKHYRRDAALRRSFNALAEKTFGLNFENWYQMGFWTGAYEPYSVVENGEVVANVSLNRTDLVIGGERRRLYQLGTVMTAEGHRNRGYIREIMAQIEKDIAGADGVYLFGNDSVLEFYPKFGFAEAKEFVYSRAVDQDGPCRMERVIMDGPENWAKLSGVMEQGEPLSDCAMVGNPGLIFFYAAQFMTDCVYRWGDIWVIAELEDGVLTLHNVFAPADVTLDSVVAAFGAEVREVVLGFTPKDRTGLICREHKEADCTFFTKGPMGELFQKEKLRVPALSHA